VIRFLAINNLNPLELELHYLNRNIHYYLNVYSNQKNLHLQVHWLLDTWNQSLAYLLIALNNSVRKSVLANFQESISSLNYAVLKFSDDDLSQISFLSDIDLCTTRLDAKKMIRFFEEHEFVHSIKVKKLGKMIQLEARLLDNSRIDVDLIFRFRRTFIDYLNVNDVLNSRVQNSKGLWLASKESNANYVLNFYILNNSEIPEKHRVWVEQPEIVEIAVIKNRIWKRKENKGVHLLLNHLSYALEIMRSMGNKQRGFLITFSGVDGAGKSTIIETIKHELEKKHRRRVIVIRHRPSILPIISAFKYGKKNAEQKSASTLPRQGTNSSKASSLLRFAYYLSDYVFGQWWIYFRHVRKNTIVLYDRYYFDFINDSRRSNIALNPAFTEQFYKLLRKPEFNFFLWASPELILRRKQELDADTIQALTERYSGLFERLQSKDSEHVYQCIENIEIEATLNLMMRIIGKKMHEADFYPTNTIEEP
jgi:thymidylate kinase